MIYIVPKGKGETTMKKILRNYKTGDQKTFEVQCKKASVKVTRLNEREIMLEGKEANIWMVIQYLEGLQK